MRTKRGCKFLALLLCVSMTFSLDLPNVTAASEPAMTQIPGTTKVEKDYDETFLSVTGFGAEGVQDRSHYYDEYVANGYKDTQNYVVVDEDYYQDSSKNRITVAEYEALSEIEKANYTLVTSEEQFCYGMAYAKVVDIRVDIECGWKYYEENNIPTYGVINPVSDYDKGNEPITSPVLMEVGISDITTRSHMTIFSPNGATLSHGCFNNNGVSDVVIRNLSIQGNYEWDDMPVGQQNANTGNNKRYGWSNISNKNAHGIWIDHCTLGISFDGNIDSKNSSQVSITWCVTGEQDMSWDSDLGKSILYMEEQYQAGNGFYIYSKKRAEGKTPYEIFQGASTHKKVSISSAGPDDYDDDPKDAVTIAYSRYVNVGSRVPAGMMGNAHMFNVYIDNADWVGMRRSMNPHHGATMGADTCVFDGVNMAVLGKEVEGEVDYVGNAGYNKLIGSVNYQLIVNSKVRLTKSSDWYTGSSWDDDGVNPFTQNGWEWSSLSTSYLKTKTFKWAEWVNVEKDASDLEEDEILITSGDAAKMANGEFYQKYYIGRDELGYNYQTFPLEDVEEITTTYAGAGNVTLENAGEWTKLYYGLEENENVVTFEDSEGTFDGEHTVVYTDNETLGELPVPVRTGYEFLGWYEGTLQEVDGTYKIVYSDTPVTKDTVVTEDMNLYAVWTVETYTLSFDTMGGSEIASIENISYGTTITAAGGFPADPTRDGFTFQGWYNSFTPETGYGAKVYANSVINADTTLYAKWRPTKVDVIFNTNGGSEVATIEDVTYNTAVTLPEAPTKDGYKFAGWYYDEALTKEFTEATKIVEKLSLDLNLYGSLTLYAKWTEVSEVTLSFETNGGTTAEAITVVPGEAVGELPIPTKAEYVFAGWYTDDTYTTEFTTASAIDVDTTVYAKWAAKGDMNQDNLVNANDALMILKYAANMLGEDEVTELKLKQADVEGTDGKVNANDALAILKYVANIITGFDS